MKGKFDLLGKKLNYSVQEGRIVNGEFLIKVAVQNWDFRELEYLRCNSETQEAETICFPDTSYIWIKVDENKFEELTQKRGKENSQ